MSDLSFSKQAIIDYSTLKKIVPANQNIFILVNKEERQCMRIMNTIESVEREIDNIQGHKRGTFYFDIVGFSEIAEKLPYC